MNATAPVRIPSRHVRSESLAPQPRRLTEVVTTSRQRRARPKVVHSVVTIAGVLAIVGAQLLLSIAISGGAYRISDLQQEQRALTRQSESLSEQLEIAAATQHLANAAAALGMVPASSTNFLDLATGAAVAAPGMPDSAGCGGTCNLVPNALTQGLPAVLPAADGGTPVAVQTVIKPAETPSASQGIPAPVTH
ncbi:MAG: hypothetical protein J7480_03095 [Microbacteriaceae bacterium]|nr:hypothetical protein [Microbacteriaceae bacterium]